MQKAVTYFTLSLVCLFMSISTCSAANWAKLNENSTSRLMIDKQSILEKDKLKRAWVKIEYKSIQKNLESPDTQYNLSKLLWYFDCPAQNAAASQVFQYLNNELVHSAAINNIKEAKFIEPVPETDFDRAMQYVCSTNRNTSAKPSATTTPTPKTPATDTKADTTPAESKPTESKAAEPEAMAGEKTSVKPDNKKPNDVKKSGAWSYQGKEGPDNWGKLSSEFSTCSTGSSQSPIDISESIDANLKPLKLLQKFPAKEILYNNHAIQLNFKDGNIVATDNITFKLKQVSFHTPSEHTIKGRAFPIEAQFLHADSKGNTTIIAVLFKEGRANTALDKIIKQLPKEGEKPATLKTRLLPSEMMPINQDYYRFSGSLTTPPCTEGIRWILIKTPMTASREQIEALSMQDNNRPLQAVNARIIVD